MKLTVVRGGGFSTPPVDGGEPPSDDGSMEARLKSLEDMLPTLATKVDIGELRTDLHKMDSSIVRWMLATVIALFLGFAGLFFTMTTATRPAAAPAFAPASMPPIIINVPGSAPSAPAPVSQAPPALHKPAP